jgi:hypothetical protein
MRQWQSYQSHQSLDFCHFALGFGTTIAEPALIAVANEAASVAQLGGLIQEIELLWMHEQN